jgi:hypothetical protein
VYRACDTAIDVTRYEATPSLIKKRDDLRSSAEAVRTQGPAAMVAAALAEIVLEVKSLLLL